MQRNAPSTFVTKSLLEPFRFIQSTFLCEEALYADKKWTLWNRIINAGVATIDKCSNVATGAAASIPMFKVNDALVVHFVDAIEMLNSVRISTMAAVM